VEVMEKCWVQEPDKRITIFEAVDALRKAIEHNNNMKQRAI